MTDPRDQLDDWLETGVTPLGPPPGTLDRIRRRARQRKTRQVVVASAACALVLGVVVAAPQIAASLRSGSKPPPVASQSSTPRTQVPTSAQPTGSGAPARTQTSGPVQQLQHTTLSTTTSGTVPPAHFRPTSVTFVGTGQGGVVGAVIGQAGPPCATSDCTSLAGTSSYGARWYGVSAPVAPGPTGDTGVSQIRFANLKDGWAFGPALWETTGGGWPWQQEDTHGQSVISLEASPQGALAIFGTCAGTGTLYATGCTSYALYGSAAGSTTWTQVNVPAAFTQMIAPSAGSSAPLLVISGSTGYVIAPSGAVLSGPVSGGAWSAVGNVPCPPVQMQLAASPTQLIASCFYAGQVTLVTSASGAQWQQASTGAVSGTPTSLATTASGQVVLATTAGIYYWADGGTTWQPASLGGPAPPGGFSYAGMTNQSQGVAVPANPSLGEVYVTGDGGKTWNPSPIAG